MKDRPCGKEHPWHKSGFINKRLSGFIIYQISSFLSLVFPVFTDRVLYKVLRDQFEDRNFQNEGTATGDDELVRVRRVVDDDEICKNLKES